MKITQNLKKALVFDTKITRDEAILQTIYNTSKINLKLKLISIKIIRMLNNKQLMGKI